VSDVRSRIGKAAAWRGRFCIVLALSLLALPARSQGASKGDGSRVVRGAVVRPGADSMVGVAGAWVVLHRVASDRAGPLDSVRTSRDGQYSIRYRISGAPDAIYFVSAEHHGIAYFSPPLDTSQTVERAELAV
jgi:hypothetical protein